LVFPFFLFRRCLPPRTERLSFFCIMASRSVASDQAAAQGAFESLASSRKLPLRGGAMIWANARSAVLRVYCRVLALAGCGNCSARPLA
jgi:hypothetical protein